MCKKIGSQKRICRPIQRIYQSRRTRWMTRLASSTPTAAADGIIISESNVIVLSPLSIKNSLLAGQNYKLSDGPNVPRPEECRGRTAILFKTTSHVGTAENPLTPTGVALALMQSNGRSIFQLNPAGSQAFPLIRSRRGAYCSLQMGAMRSKLHTAFPVFPFFRRLI